MVPIQSCISEQFVRRGRFLVSTMLRRCLVPSINTVQSRREKKDDSNINSLFRPVPVKPTSDEINIGAELTTSLDKKELMKVLSYFTHSKTVKQLTREYGLDSYVQNQSFISFRQYCLETESLPVDLHIVLSDIIQGVGNITDIFPYFIRHAKQTFPHLNCLDDLKKIGDLRSPANWYPAARAKTRKVIFHAGPTNSGKTYHALERFMNATSGVYCGPLKLLAVEVFNKCNANGTPCDLVTGEERRYAHGPENPANHLSCSVEMVNVNNDYTVAVIDEIQLLKDQCRGWAWTRALLGIPADEIHLCGEEAALDIVHAICSTTGETVEVRKYKRLTELKIEDKALGTLHNVRPGDCIVCFNKNDIFTVSRTIESLGNEVAVIYGSLPPGTKLAQAEKFNDPKHTCKILVATNAIGMGLNLHINRIIFYSLIQPTINEKGEKEMDILSVSSALQIAGRAGRYGTRFGTGYVTTFKNEDLSTLKKLLSQTPEVITQAGLHPTADQIELYAYNLPNYTLSNLMDIFVSLCTVDDSLYFMCNMDDFKFLAAMIEHVPLPLRARYVFCCAPINRKVPFVCTMFLKFARQYSKNDPITFSWLCTQIGWPFQAPKTIVDLVHLEGVFDIMDLYLWLSYRFSDLFPDITMVRDMQKELDSIIQTGVFNLTALLIRTSTDTDNEKNAIVQEDNFELQTRKQRFYKDSQPRRRPTTSPVGKGKLTERLLAEGLLTPQMLKELQEEWAGKSKK